MSRFTIRRQAGFSLLELMVVVAIIGVLAAVAVPRFNIFRARARQAEAKSNLGVIFTLQEAFKIDKERYYNGNGSYWGGAFMDKEAGANSVGYPGGGATAAATDCGANKLGFRLANCTATRYKYWVDGALENTFLVKAYADSDVTVKRIFPGCKGTHSTIKTAADSTSPAGKKCTATGTETDLTAAGGDAFCLDHSRVLDNFRDIVADVACVN